MDLKNMKSRRGCRGDCAVCVDVDGCIDAVNLVTFPPYPESYDQEYPTLYRRDEA